MILKSRKFLIFLLIVSFSNLCLFPSPKKNQLNKNSAKSVESESENFTQISKISLTFAGDIMAHTNVTRMKDFSLIYKDILDISKNDDLTFANFESPVVDSQDYENWPHFNARNAYVYEAVDSGIDVFSLTNNHTNDQGLVGITTTRDFFKSLEQEKNIWACGIKDEAYAPYTYRVIEKNGIKVLFLAVTEICNSTRFNEWYDITDRSEETRKSFLKTVTQLRKENPCDIFVVAFHCYEPEYVISVTEKRKNYYHALLDAGIDIVWANHPHVIQEREIVRSAQNPQETKFIMYSVGNLISGQRPRRNYENPEAPREYTGESIMMQINFVKMHGKVYATDFDTIYLTNHTDGNGTYIKKLNSKFINQQNEQDKKYYTTRLELVEKIEGNVIWR